MQKILEKLYNGHKINYEQSKKIFHGMLTKKLSLTQITAILISIKIHKETFEEISGAAFTLLKYAKKFPKPNYLFSDISGTGGDFSNTINISTISAIVASTCGIRVVKHGNYGISSLTGSGNLLQDLNIDIETDTKNSITLLDKFGICFLHAPIYHKILNYIAPMRKELKTPTLFNIIGPLINPSKPPITLIGVYKKELLFPIAKTLQFFQYHRAAVIHCGGIDEVGLHAPTHVMELHNKNIKSYVLTAEDFGLKPQPISIFCYKNIKESRKEFIINLLKGNGLPAHSDIIAANVSLLLKLFGHENLKNNTAYVLKNIQNGIPYSRLISLLNFKNKNYEK